MLSCAYACHECAWKSECVNPRILNPGSRWSEWLFSLPGRFSLREKSLQYPLIRRLGEFQSRSGRFEEKFPIPGTEPRFLGCPARRLVTVLTELYRLLKEMVR
jgi:hypothetical protein